MNCLPRARRTASLLLAAALLASAAPARQTARTPAAKPRAQAAAPARPKPAQPSSARPTPQPQPPSAQPSSAQSSAQSPAAQPSPSPAAQSAASAAEVTIENMFGAESYAIYAEMRMVGQYLNSQELKQLIEPLRLPRGVSGMTEQGLIEFVAGHAEQLLTARVALAAMPSRAGVPGGVVAVELASQEEARKLVPAMRAALAGYGVTLQGEEGVPQRASAQARGRRRGAQAATVKTAADDQTPQGNVFQIRRAGRVIALSDQPFTFKQLRGAAKSAALTSEPGFQAVRSRFVNDSLFVYFNTTRMNAAWRRQMEEHEANYRKMAEEQERAEAAAAGKQGAGNAELTQTVEPRAVTADVTLSGVKIDAGAATPPPGDPDVPDSLEGLPPEVKARLEKERAEAEEAKTKRTPEEIEKERQAEQRREFENMLVQVAFGGGGGGIAGSGWPESIGVGASLDGESAVVRAFLLTESEDVPLRPVPFIPVLHSGPPISPEAANVLPAGTDIFVSASLDLPGMYDYVASMFKIFDVAAGTPEKQGLFDSQVGAFEREHKFRIREDLLAALGNEIAFALPSEFLGVRGRRTARIEAAAKEASASASPGATPPPARPDTDAPIVVVSLNDKRAVQELLPRALAAAGISGLNAQQLLEKRGQAEVVTFSQGAVAFIDRFLVLCDPLTMNEVIEAYNSGRTLATSDEFRDPTSWQPRRHLGQLYVSNEMLKGMLGDIKKESEDVEDEGVRAYVAQLDPNPGSVTLAATKDGGLMYELHVPKNLLSLWSAYGLVAQHTATRRSNESSAFYQMHRLAAEQQSYKSNHGRYATLEELRAEAKKIAEAEGAGEGEGEGEEDGPGSYWNEPKVDGYEIKLSVTADGFRITATPTAYPKEGRRSYFIDETMVLRAADLGGRPATATTDPAR